MSSVAPIPRGLSLVGSGPETHTHTHTNKKACMQKQHLFTLESESSDAARGAEPYQRREARHCRSTGRLRSGRHTHNYGCSQDYQAGPVCYDDKHCVCKYSMWGLLLQAVKVLGLSPDDCSLSCYDNLLQEGHVSVLYCNWLSMKVMKVVDSYGASLAKR